MPVTHETPQAASASTVADDPIHLPKLVSDEFEISTSEARRLIVQGGVKLDGENVSLDCPADSLKGKTLTVGKRRSVKL